MARKLDNMYEVEFKFDSEDDDYDSRSVQVYADTIQEAKDIATYKFSKLYKNFEIVEIEKEEYDYDDYEEEEYADGGKIGYGKFRQLRNDKPIYYNQDAIYYQTYGELNDNGYNVDKGVAKVFKKTTGLREIAYYKKDKDYEVVRENRDESGLITYIEFVEVSQPYLNVAAIKKYTISFILTDLYRMGGETSQYRYEPSSLGEDMIEARVYLGEKKWKSLSRDEKKEITNYLKSKGQIGIFGQEEDLETLSSLQYRSGGITRSTDVSVRKSPSISATVYDKGYKMIGNDGNLWEIVIDSRGVHRWQKSHGEKSLSKQEIDNIKEAIELMQEIGADSEEEKEAIEILKNLIKN